MYNFYFARCCVFSHTRRRRIVEGDSASRVQRNCSASSHIGVDMSPLESSMFFLFSFVISKLWIFYATWGGKENNSPVFICAVCEQHLWRRRTHSPPSARPRGAQLGSCILHNRVLSMSAGLLFIFLYLPPSDPSVWIADSHCGHLHRLMPHGINMLHIMLCFYYHFFLCEPCRKYCGVSNT